MSYLKILKELRNIRVEKEQSLINGYATDFASYRFAVGEIQGIQTAITILDKLFIEEEDYNDN
jgi:hypothetical protein